MDNRIFSAFGLADIQQYLSFIDADYWLLLTFLGGGTMAFLLAVAGCVLLKNKFAMTMALLTTFAGILVIVLKQLIQEPRPYLLTDSVNVFKISGGFGMPSGHSANALVIVFVIGLFLKSRLAWPALFALAVLIGLSRNAIGVHSFGQVCAGLALGVLVCAAYTVLSHRYSRAPIATPTLLFITAALSAAFIAINFYTETQVVNSFVIPDSWIENNHRAQTAVALFEGIQVAELSQPRLFTGQILFLTAFFLGTCLSLIALPFAVSRSSNYTGNTTTQGYFATSGDFATSSIMLKVIIGVLVIAYTLLTLYVAHSLKQHQAVVFGLVALLPLVISVGIPFVLLRNKT